MHILSYKDVKQDMLRFTLYVNDQKKIGCFANEREGTEFYKKSLGLFFMPIDDLKSEH